MPGHGEQLSKDLTLAEFRQFRDYIHKHSGIFLEESKLDSLRISLLARATRLDCTGWDAYFETLSHDEAEFRELMSLITINETSFFRFPGQFDALRTHVLPEIANARTGDSKSLRVWSAGCSTGEEPYSIAMTLSDSGLEPMGWRGEVMGTDVSTKALGIAKAGVYPARAVASLSDELIRRHFVRVDDSYRVASHPRSMVEFAYHNLIKEPYPLALMGNWDVIFCRNVTIYFKLESTRRVVDNFHNSLNEGGYLFIGHSETLTSISDRFEVVEVGGVFLYRKPRHRRLHVPGAFHSEPERAGDAARIGERRRPLTTPDVRAGRPGGPERDDAAVLARRAERERRAASQAAGSRTVEASAAARSRTPEAPAEAAGGGTDALLDAAHAHADAGDYARALEECERALTANPLLPGARYLLGVIRQRQGDVAHAVSEFKKTVYIDPDFALAHMSLGNIMKADGRYRDAVRAYENSLRALYKNPEGEWTRFLGGWTADVVLKTVERSLLECRKATGSA